MSPRGPGRRRWFTSLVVVTIASVAVIGCASDDDGDSAAAEPEPFEWAVVDPAEHDMDADVLEEARVYAFDETEHTQGVVVVRGGDIVAEWYGEGADADSYAASWSMAKSFTSALVGIAIEDGLIESVEEPMTTWYPEWEADERRDITLRDILWMSSGLQYTESYNPADLDTSDIIQLVLFQPDQLAYMVDRPLAHPPGEVWNYSSGDTLLLSGVLEQVTGMQVSEYAAEQIFDPLDIEGAEWWEDTAGTTLTYCCLDMTTRDFARFGQLYLDDGEWQGERIVSSAWVQESLEPAPTADFYGYQWWLHPANGESDDAGDEDDTESADASPPLDVDYFRASGHDGQFIYVIPSLDLVVVRNGTYIKHDGPPVADPSLFALYPPDLVEGAGTTAPSPSWDHDAFLAPIVASVLDADEAG